MKIIIYNTFFFQQKCVDFNKYDPDVINFYDKYKDEVTYLEKLKVVITIINLIEIKYNILMFFRFL